MMKLEVARCIDEYLSIIERVKASMGLAWFRGQSKASYALIPSLFREDMKIRGGRSVEEIVKAKFIMQDDFAALQSFKKHFPSIHPYDGFKDIDYLYMMQHYEVPTRLLDFSTDELVALYFAVSGSDSKKTNVEAEIEDFNEMQGESELGAAVYCIDPIKTNDQTSLLGEKPIELSAYSFKSLRNIDLPVCIETSNPDKRIIAQKGVFVFFGSFVNSYDYYTVLNKMSVKIFIPNSCKKQIFLELREVCNKSHFSIYPDIKGLALDIRDEMRERYDKDCEDVNSAL